MGFLEHRNQILAEVTQCVQAIDQEIVLEILEKLTQAKTIFCDGLGRTGLQTRGFAMRLAQMGLTAYDVTDATTPAIASGDLLLVCSGSGETGTLVAHGKKALAVGASTLVITTDEGSTLGKLGQTTLVIPAKGKYATDGISAQPMGALFEQALGLFLDILVKTYMESHQITEESMQKRHKNLE